MNRRLLLLLIGLILAALPARAASGELSPERLMVLVVGPTSQPIHPDEGDAVQRLNLLRRQNGLDRMKLATMHWDQPQQARFCRDRLGLQRTDLVAVTLVELDASGAPRRALYTVPRVTARDLDRLQGTITKWSQVSGVPLGLPPGEDDAPVRAERMTAEGIMATARRLDSLTAALWEGVRNEPLRRDQADRSARRALLGLAENSRLLRQALEQGQVFPRDQFALVLASSREWKASEPQFTLPVRYRVQVPPIDEALAGIRQAWNQLSGGDR